MRPDHVHLASEALTQGHSVAFIEPWDWEVDASRRVVVRAHVFDGSRPMTNEAIVGALQRGGALRRVLAIQDLGLLMLRVAPYRSDVMSLGALARDQGVPVVNDPDGMTRVAHKGWLAAQRDVRTYERRRGAEPPRTSSTVRVRQAWCASSPGGRRARCVFVPPNALHQLDAAGRIDHGVGHVVVQST